MTTREKDFLGSGWRYPVKPGADGRLAYQSGPEKIQQSIWLILGTALGERIMLPEFGAGIHEYVFRPNDAATRGMLSEQVVTSLRRFEPRINVLDVRVEQDQDPASAQRVFISIDYRIRASNSVYNLVYPFYLTESGG